MAARSFCLGIVDCPVHGTHREFTEVQQQILVQRRFIRKIELPCATASARSGHGPTFHAITTAGHASTLKGRDEIKKALKHNLPRLVGDKDLRRVLHSHTTASDGTETLETPPRLRNRHRQGP